MAETSPNKDKPLPMNNIDIKQLMNDTSQLSAETLPELKALVEQYPFFQAARLLYVTNLYKQRSRDFGTELRKAAVFVPDRTALFFLTEGVHYEISVPESASNIETESDGERTLSLINRFLHEGEAPVSRREEAAQNAPTVIDLTNDYIPYLLQQDAAAQPSEGKDEQPEPRLKGGDLIDSFINETKGKQRVEMPEANGSEFVSPVFSDEEEEVYTENMVNIYIKQGRYKQALEILNKISLNNPRKSANFATQKTLLEALLNQGK